MDMYGEVIVVAVDASKEITDYALEWAIRNVVKATDSLVLLAILPSNKRPPSRANHSGTHNFLSCLMKKWGIGSGHKEGCASDRLSMSLIEQDLLRRINTVCENMMQQQLRSSSNHVQVLAEVNVVGDAHLGAVAAKSAQLEANWVILDRRLKKEADCCLKQLDCNIVLIDHDIPKVLRAVDHHRAKKSSVVEHEFNPAVADMLGVLPANKLDWDTVTPRSSLGLESPRGDTDKSVSASSADHKEQSLKDCPSNSFLHLDSHRFHQRVNGQASINPSPSNNRYQPLRKASSFDIKDLPRKSCASPSEWKIKSYSGLLKIHSDTNEGYADSIREAQTAATTARRSTDSQPSWRKPRTPNQPKHVMTRRCSLPNNKTEACAAPCSQTIDRTSSIRRAMSLSTKHPPIPPPLCSICKHNTPIFGKAPKKFSYKEMLRATDGFSSKNFLAKGGYGPVYKGVLPDGQVVAVKQQNTLSAQGASEFCSEVEVLSCAQHRNLVMLVGYCIENEWLLVYEYACNGSLDKHLYGTETNVVMSWHNRMKVALGAARGLRYLHEDCRVGCIVHRDFRPNNILLTHDFEPMVGDFGLARWQADGQFAEETRVIGSFGYLAPEYAQTGLITEKADVYAFGVVLLELLSGFRTTEFSRNTGQQFVAEWGSPLLEGKIISEVIDPRLKGSYARKEVECMMYAASLCVSPQPEKRPRISKVLKILEGDMHIDMACESRQHTPQYQTERRSNIRATERPLNQVLSFSSQLMQHNMYDVNQSLSRKSAEYSICEGTSLLNKHRVVSSDWDVQQNDQSFSDEYQMYLQGSLAKFIQNSCSE